MDKEGSSYLYNYGYSYPYPAYRDVPPRRSNDAATSRRDYYNLPERSDYADHPGLDDKADYGDEHGAFSGGGHKECCPLVNGP